MSSPDQPEDTESAGRLLDCGRDPVDVVDRARAGRTSAHEGSCPYCRAVIDADGVARTAAGAYVDSELDHPVPDTLLPNVMSTVWADLRRSTMIPLGGDPADEPGTAFVADHTVAAVIEHALDELTQFQIQTCSARADGPAVVAIEITAAASYNTDVRAVAARARDIVRSTAAEQFGWTAEPIDIEIVDVYVSGSAAS